MDLTRTSKTEKEYLKRAEGLLRATSNYFGIEINDVTGMMLAQFIVDHRVEYTPATFRQYKSAIKFYLKIYSHLFIDAEDAIIMLEDVSQSDCNKITLRTSQLRRKHFKASLFERFIYTISLSNSKYTEITIFWLQAGALTGLRPHEWEFAILDKREDDRLFLIVHNAKNTNGRSHGELRHIELTYLSEHEKNIIEKFLSIVADYKESGTFALLQHACMKFLSRENNKLVKGKFKEKGYNKQRGSGLYRAASKKPTRITLYSARHFFSSSAKTAMLSLEEIAALMGHKTNKTASEHYGKRHYGQGGFKVKPVTAEVAKIEKKYSNTLSKNAQPQTNSVPSQTESNSVSQTNTNNAVQSNGTVKNRRM